MNNELTKSLLAIGLAILCATSAQAGTYVNPGAKCDVSPESRFGAITEIYNGSEYQKIDYITFADYAHGYVMFTIAGSDRIYSTDFANITETPGDDNAPILDSSAR